MAEGQDRKETLVERTAKALVNLSLQRCEGDFLGAEPDMLNQLNVSRPTLREAAKIAEYDRMIAVRKGPGGGYYAARPTAQYAIRGLLHFLRLQGATFSDVLAISGPVMEEAVAKASRCQDQALRSALEAVAKKLGQEGPAETVRAEEQFVDIVALMSGNVYMELIKAVTYSFGVATIGEAFYKSHDRREMAGKTYREIDRAIRRGDAEVASLLMRRWFAELRRWLDGEA